MAVTLFFGLLAGGLLGMSVRDQRTPLCCFMMKKHPTFTKSLGLVLLAGLILVPSLALSGAITISATPFFWGGMVACSFIFGFFTASCVCTPEPQGS
ncbi:MAG: hypothetical protein ACOY0R_14760 [Chloroflexota bacterium]